MSQDTEQAAQVEAEQPTHEQGSEDEAVNALLGKQAETADEPEDEPQAEADEEPEQGETEEADAAEKLAEVEYEGKTYKVAPELEKALLRQSDYSRRMNEVGAKEKDYEQRIETADRLIEGAEKYAKALAKVDALDIEIGQFEKVNWQQLERENQSQAALLGLKLVRLQQARDVAQREAGKVGDALDQDRQKDMAAKRDAMLKVLAKDINGWGPELGTKITEYAVKSGYSFDQIAQITDPKWVVMADKARKFDAIQDGKAAVRGKAAAAPPVSKPGARRPQPNQAKDAMAKLRQSNSSEDAEAAFLARMR